MEPMKPMRLLLFKSMSDAETLCLLFGPNNKYIISMYQIFDTLIEHYVLLISTLE